MSSVAPRQRLRLTIQNPEEKRDKLSGRDVLAEETVDFAANARWALGLRRKRTHGRLHVSHQQRRRHTLAHYVRDAEAYLVFAKAKHVKVVAAHFACRLPGRRHLEPGNLRNGLGQQRFLDLPRPMKLLFLYLKLRRACLYRLLQFPVALLQPLSR